jgi:crotonobetainyl-CoA:carnitine CoA-transferase CaiB-like acyl-CoA transferase
VTDGKRPPLHHVGGGFSYFHDSKYGVIIDLKKPEGVELAQRLAGWCDVVIENTRSGSMSR